MEIPLHIGLEGTKVDSMFLIWPDNSYQAIKFNKNQRKVQINYQRGLPIFDYSKITAHNIDKSDSFSDIGSSVNLAVYTQGKCVFRI